VQFGQPRHTDQWWFLVLVVDYPVSLLGIVFRDFAESHTFWFFAVVGGLWWYLLSRVFNAVRLRNLLLTRSRWPFELAAQPLSPLIMVLMASTYARLKLGYWPSYNHPDPEDVLTSPFWAVLFLFPPLLIGVFVSPVLTFAIAAFRRDWKLIVVAVISSVAFWTWIMFDPGGQFSWFLD